MSADGSVSHPAIPSPNLSVSQSVGYEGIVVLNPDGTLRVSVYSVPLLSVVCMMMDTFGTPPPPSPFCVATTKGRVSVIFWTLNEGDIVPLKNTFSEKEG